MTHWLTDSPDRARAFVPRHVDWQACDEHSPESVCALARYFNPNRSTWHTALESEAGEERVQIIIDSAPESQFDKAMEIVKGQGRLPDGLVCLALTGQRFRGQRQRPWTALRGNLHLTTHYELGLPAADIQAALTMIPAVASAETIAELVPSSRGPTIKWVNDVLLSGKKVSGVLTATQVSGPMVDRAVFGIGMNIAASPTIEPTPFVPRAGCLTEVITSLADALPSVYDMIVTKLDELVAALRAGRTRSIFDRYRAFAGFVGEKVRVWPEGVEDWRAVAPVAQGAVSELHPDLSLTVAGFPGRIASGRLAFESSCRELEGQIRESNE